METKAKEVKPRKKLTLHKHYLVDIRRFSKELGITEEDFGKSLETKIITRNKVKFLALRVI